MLCCTNVRRRLSTVPAANVDFDINAGLPEWAIKHQRRHRLDAEQARHGPCSASSPLATSVQAGGIDLPRPGTPLVVADELAVNRVRQGQAQQNITTPAPSRQGNGGVRCAVRLRQGSGTRRSSAATNHDRPPSTTHPSILSCALPTLLANKPPTPIPPSQLAQRPHNLYHHQPVSLSGLSHHRTCSPIFVSVAPIPNMRTEIVFKP